MQAQTTAMKSKKKLNQSPLNTWNVCWEVIYKMTLEPFLIM